MPKLARLFHSADDVVEAWRDALSHRDVQGALDIWLDDDSILAYYPRAIDSLGMQKFVKAWKDCLRNSLYF